MRSHLCGSLNAENLGLSVSLCGWVARRRDHGGVIFIDLRDRSGIMQLVADPTGDTNAYEIANKLRIESVIRVRGTLRVRPDGTQNSTLPTGEVELIAQSIEVFNLADTMPFQFDEAGQSEEVRLQHRHLDLRSQRMHENLQLRHNLITAIRESLNSQEFLEIETPILTRSTPEGARDYLVPSRVYPGHFFALPQSPQIFKQLLMIAGFERYYQIARCFRDEDLRADRQPEFTQLDMEMSFVEEADVMRLVEDMIRTIFHKISGIDLPNPFPRISYQQAMEKYGTDRPDLRNPLQLVEISDLLRDVEFKVFSGPANSANGRVAAMAVSRGNQLSRSKIDHYTDFVRKNGAKGLAYIRLAAGDAGAIEPQSPILKFLPTDVVNKIVERLQAKVGDIIFFGADVATVVNRSLAALRIKIGNDLGLLQQTWSPLWITDFPLIELDPISGKWNATHHPFTAPKAEDLDKLESMPNHVLSRAYDIVLNGIEIGGGSIRIHDPHIQNEVFSALGIEAAEADEKFGFLLRALSHGAPPHGGIALGLDRISAMLTGSESIREVIAFPKTQKAACPLTDAPGSVRQQQLKELGLSVMAKREQKPEEGSDGRT